MKTYLFKVLFTAALSVLVVHLLTIFYVRSPIYAAYWTREMLIAKRYMIRDLPSPKIVIAAGSNALFGIDAIQMEKSLNIPTFNFGLHAGLRLDFLLDEFSKVVQPGDILIIPLEGHYYQDHRTWTQEQLRNALAWDPVEFDSCTLREKLVICYQAAPLVLSNDLIRAKLQEIGLPQSLTRRLEALEPEDKIIERFKRERGTCTDFAYSMDNLDNRGDILHTSGSNFTGEPIPLWDPRIVTPSSQQILKDFVAKMKARKVTVYFARTPYTVDGTHGDDWRVDERRFNDGFQNLGCEMLGERDQFFYPRSYFFNTSLHLNEKGRAVRTEKIIELLRPKLTSPPPVPR